MDDGCIIGSGFRLWTDSYSKDDNLFLIKVLKDNFDLDYSLHIYRKDHYIIYISSKSMNKFRNLVSPYFHDTMTYKLNNKIN
jgi:hypothetical protein